MRPPCKDCKERAIGCHSTCEKYKKYRTEWEELKKKKAEEKRLWSKRNHKR